MVARAIRPGAGARPGDEVDVILAGVGDGALGARSNSSIERTRTPISSGRCRRRAWRLIQAATASISASAGREGADDGRGAVEDRLDAGAVLLGAVEFEQAGREQEVGAAADLAARCGSSPSGSASGRGSRRPRPIQENGGRKMRWPMSPAKNKPLISPGAGGPQEAELGEAEVLRLVDDDVVEGRLALAPREPRRCRGGPRRRSSARGRAAGCGPARRSPTGRRGGRRSGGSGGRGAGGRGRWRRRGRRGRRRSGAIRPGGSRGRRRRLRPPSPARRERRRAVATRTGPRRRACSARPAERRSATATFARRGEEGELGAEAVGEALVVGGEQDAGGGIGAGEADGAVEGDDGLAGAGAAGDAGGAGEVACRRSRVWARVEEDRPLLPRGVEGAGELVGSRRGGGSGAGRRGARRGRASARAGAGWMPAERLMQRLQRLGGEVGGEVEERVLGGGADVGEPVGRDAAEEQRRLRGAGEEGRPRGGCRRRSWDRDGDFLNAFADFDELGGAGRRVGLEAAALGPGVGGVVVADPGEEGVGPAFVQDDAEVAGDAGGPEVAVAGAVDAVELRGRERWDRPGGRRRPASPRPSPGRSGGRGRR